MRPRLPLTLLAVVVLSAGLTTAGCLLAADLPSDPTPVVVAPAVPSTIDLHVVFGFGNSAGFAFLTVNVSDAKGRPVATPITVSVSPCGIAKGLVAIPRVHRRDSGADGRVRTVLGDPRRPRADHGDDDSRAGDPGRTTDDSLTMQRHRQGSVIRQFVHAANRLPP